MYARKGVTLLSSHACSPSHTHVILVCTICFIASKYRKKCLLVMKSRCSKHNISANYQNCCNTDAKVIYQVLCWPRHTNCRSTYATSGYHHKAAQSTISTSKQRSTSIATQKLAHEGSLVVSFHVVSLFTRNQVAKQHLKSVTSLTEKYSLMSLRLSHC